MSGAVIYPAVPEKILKELGQVWTRLAKEEAGHGKPTVLRACAMTLIVATDDQDEQGFTAAQTLTELMHEHPSRGIVLNVSDKGEKGLEARVLAQCWKPFGKAQQICCEQIEIMANPQNWPNVGPTVIGIMAADLPVVLWSRQKIALSASATSEQKAGLDSVMGFARKTVVDTAGTVLNEAFEVIAGWRVGGRIVSDLEWTRITLWRQALANVFNDSGEQHKASQYQEVEVSYAGESPDAGVLYWGGWLKSALGAKVSIVPEVNAYGSGWQRITLRSSTDVIALSRTSEDCVTLSSGGREQRYNYQDPSLYSLMNEELSVLGPDEIFDAAFTEARELRKG